MQTTQFFSGEFSIILSAGILFSFTACLFGQETVPPKYKNPKAPVEKRVDDLLSRMTLEEKADMLSGDPKTGFDSRANQRLGIPVLHMTDGPVGVRWAEPSTAYPVSVVMASTWNPELVNEIGKALGQETRAKGRNVLLAPCVNIHRVPHAGRNFESYGEDPYLAAEMAVAYIKGVQSEKVIATVKHFACNNQEFERNSIDVKVCERALHEIYLPAFKAAVQEAGVWAVMSSYNRLNGFYASSNTVLLTDILKRSWGFKGFVMSDWGAVHSVEPTLFAGLDIEMPTDSWLKTKDVVDAVKNGLMKESRIDDKVRRMLRAMFAMGFFDGTPDAGSADTPEHRAIALKTAQEGIVLLKNSEDLLPIDRSKIKSIAVIGPNADVARTGGGGSSRIRPFHSTSPLDALKTRLDKATKVRFAKGCFLGNEYEPIQTEYLQPPDGKKGETGLLAEYWDNASFEGEPKIKRIDKQINFPWGSEGPEGIGNDFFSVRWTGKIVPPKSGKFVLTVASDDGTRLYVNGSLLIDNWGFHAVTAKSAEIPMKAGVPLDIKVEFFENAGGAAAILGWHEFAEDPVEEAVKLAGKSDMAIVFAGYSDDYESEGFDRKDLILPPGQDKLIRAVAAVNKNTVVVLNIGAPVLTNGWIDAVPALVHAGYPGQEGGFAVADVLLGNTNPSGKLVDTFFKAWEDNPAFGNYPGADDVEKYTEGIFVGYRHSDRKNIDVVFPFGYGLSYTRFAYSDLKVAPAVVEQGENVEISLNVKNIGTREGADVVQLYLGDEASSVPRPKKELKGFKKVFLEPGETKQVNLVLPASAMKYYDIGTKDWKAEPGKFLVFVGSSSRDIRLTGGFELK